jgi:hypothetical protein
VRNIFTGILIAIVLGLFLDVVYLHREVAEVTKEASKQKQINQALYQYQHQQWELLQATMRDVDAVNSHVAVWAEVFQERPEVE